MNILIGAAILALQAFGVGVPLANGTTESAAFLRIPDAVSPCPDGEAESFQSAALPGAVSDHLWRGYYQPYGLAKLPDVIRGFALDLNQDAVQELILETPLGGSGGPHYVVVADREGGWTEVLSFQGWFCLLPVVEGWHPIVAIYRGGAEIYAKTRYDFAGGHYHSVWSARFDRGKITQER